MMVKNFNRIVRAIRTHLSLSGEIWGRNQLIRIEKQENCNMSSKQRDIKSHLSPPNHVITL